MFEAYCKRNVIVYFIIMLFLSKYITLLYVSVTTFIVKILGGHVHHMFLYDGTTFRGNFITQTFKTQNTLYFTIKIKVKIIIIRYIK
jgi:predicted benzoate:H+ symporter BenE